MQLTANKMKINDNKQSAPTHVTLEYGGEEYILLILNVAN